MRTALADDVTSPLSHAGTVQGSTAMFPIQVLRVQAQDDRESKQCSFGQLPEQTLVEEETRSALALAKAHWDSQQSADPQFGPLERPSADRSCYQTPDQQAKIGALQGIDGRNSDQLPLWH